MDLVHCTLLALHVLAGAVGLALGPFVVRAGWRGHRARGRSARDVRRAHVRLGWPYAWTTATLCGTAVALVALDPALWGFLLIAGGTSAAVLVAIVARRRHRPGWEQMHVRAACGSYVAFPTALSVQVLPPWGWVAVVVVGSVWTARQTAAAARTTTAGLVPATVPFTATASRYAVSKAWHR